ncbi:hypothetical protein PYW49_23195 [Enterobacter sp. 170198]|uniref:RHS repeat protein n=1 Tax=Enterobacter chinensis TaxID=3030997 RepID=A0ABU5D982_9ENTR|nr:hypothetical protein [Enterobacter sp. 170198]MDY0420556.1 hypothetical protein [Enterobacter sp. 170198]
MTSTAAPSRRIGLTRWHYRCDGEYRLTEVISQSRDRNRPQTQVSFRYDPLG